MRNFIRFGISSLPFVVGLIFTLAALAFLVKFTHPAADGDEFFGFFFSALIGLPLTLYGMRSLAKSETP